MAANRASVEPRYLPSDFHRNALCPVMGFVPEPVVNELARQAIEGFDRAAETRAWEIAKERTVAEARAARLAVAGGPPPF